MGKTKSKNNSIFRFLKNIKYTNKLLLFFSVVLFVFGLVMIFSSSNVTAFVRYHKTPYYFVLKEMVFYVMGIIVFIVVSNIDTSKYGKLSWLGVLCCMGLLLLAYFSGFELNETKGWVGYGPVKFQPSEITKVVFIAWIATFFEIKKLGVNKMSVSLFCFCIGFALAGLIVLANDFGTAFILVAIIYLCYWLIPISMLTKLKTIFLVTFLASIVLIGYYVFDTSSFQRQTSRLANFQEPCSEENFYSTGNQVCNSIIAINNGNLFGKGLGSSTQKYLYLPESHTDFIFAIVVEECGLVGGALTVLLIMLIIILCISIGSKSKTFRGSIICYGVAIYIFLHTAINLCGIMGVIPLTGVPLPFISYGGTFAVCLIFGLSMVQRVAIENRKEKLGKS